MSIREFYDFWLMLLRFSSAAWDFLGMRFGTVVWDAVESLNNDYLDNLIIMASAVRGYPHPSQWFETFFGGMSVLEFVLGAGITFVLGYKFLTWVLDVFF